MECVFLEKGVKVVRSTSEILNLIKSCDDTTVINVHDTVQPASHPVTNILKLPLELPHNGLKKSMKSIGPKRMINTVKHQPTDVGNQPNSKEIVAHPFNNSSSKRLILFFFLLQCILFVFTNFNFFLDLTLRGASRLIKNIKPGKEMDILS